MKRLYLFLCICMAIAVQAQQSTFIYFEDKDGERDSLEVVIGLTDEQIADIPMIGVVYAGYKALRDGPLWVLIDGPQNYQFSHVYAYMPYDGFIEKGRKNIYIRADRLPVTISWDKQFFVDNDLTGSVLSDWNIWFEARCKDEDINIVKMAFSDSCVAHYTVRDYGQSCTYQNWMNDLLVKEIGLSVGTIQNYGEGVEAIPDGLSATKILRNGQILILRGDKTYTLQGQQVE